MNKHNILTDTMLIQLWLLYNKVEWALVIDVMDFDESDDLLDLFETAKLNVDIENCDSHTLVIQGKENDLRELFDTFKEVLMMNLWHNGNIVERWWNGG